MIEISEYIARRQAVANALPPNALAVIPAAKERTRNGDVHYRFRQDSDFYYLTGFEEPDALLLITSGKQSASILFNRPTNLLEEQWTGKRLGQAQAPQQLGVDEAFSIEQLDELLPRLFTEQQVIYYPSGRYPDIENRLRDTWHEVKAQERQGVYATHTFADITPILNRQRIIKSDAELAIMRKVTAISVQAHQRAMRSVSKARYEYQLEAELCYEMIKHGCRNMAYDPIVAVGSNACVLHYTANNSSVEHGQLVLIDAGAELHNYAADITRTFPVSGTFSSEQRAIYQLVLNAQKAGLSCIRPGCAWHEIQSAIVKELTAGLLDLGLLRGHLDTLIEQEAYKPFYMHQSGHWLGLDVHDSGEYKINGKWRSLQAGMVLTVEPGLYISPLTPNIDARWHGIGVRIEDDIHVTAEGYENLTAALVSEVDEIEAYIRG